MVIKLARCWAAKSLYAGIVFWVALLSPGPHTAKALAETISSRQQLQSAYLYNFLLFVHWPQEEQATSQSIMTICIVGDDSLGEQFTPVVGKAIKDTKYVLKVKNIRSPLHMADLDGCAMLFIAQQSPTLMQEILVQVKDLPILTVSDQPDFAEIGGILALVEENGKLRWRINQYVATHVGLRFDAQLLRNAAAVINTKQEGQ